MPTNPFDSGLGPNFERNSKALNITSSPVTKGYGLENVYQVPNDILDFATTHSILPASDMYESRAQAQSVGARLANALPRLALTTGTKLLEGFGVLGGIVGAAGMGIGNLFLPNDKDYTNEDMWSMAIDNSMVNFFESIEDSVKNDLLPVYKTKQYLNGNVWQQMGTASFWTDDFIDGLAFMASTMIPGAILSKIGTGAAMARGLANVAKFTKLGNVVIKAGEIGKPAITLGSKFLRGSASMEKLTKGMNFIQTMAFMNTMEAGFEARDQQKQIEAAMRDTLNPLTGQPYTENEIKTASSEAAADIFKFNMIALTISNAVEVGAMMKMFNTAKRGAVTVADLSKLKHGTKPLTKLEKFGIFAGNAALTSVSEGAYEENIQSAIQNLYKGDPTENISEVEKLRRIGKGWLSNWSDDEGQKAIVLGSLIGFIPGGFGGLSEAKQENKNRINYINAITNANERYRADYRDLYEYENYNTENGEIKERIKLDANGKPVINKEKRDAFLEDRLRKGFKLALELKEDGTFATETEAQQRTANLHQSGETGNSAAIAASEYQALQDFLTPYLQAGLSGKALEIELDALATEHAKMYKAFTETYTSEQNKDNASKFILDNTYKKLLKRYKGFAKEIEGNFNEANNRASLLNPHGGSRINGAYRRDKAQQFFGLLNYRSGSNIVLSNLNEDVINYENSLPFSVRDNANRKANRIALDEYIQSLERSKKQQEDKIEEIKAEIEKNKDNEQVTSLLEYHIDGIKSNIEILNDRLIERKAEYELIKEDNTEAFDLSDKSIEAWNKYKNDKFQMLEYLDDVKLMDRTLAKASSKVTVKEEVDFRLTEQKAKKLAEQDRIKKEKQDKEKKDSLATKATNAVSKLLNLPTTPTNKTETEPETEITDQTPKPPKPISQVFADVAVESLTQEEFDELVDSSNINEEDKTILKAAEPKDRLTLLSPLMAASNTVVQSEKTVAGLNEELDEKMTDRKGTDDIRPYIPFANRNGNNVQSAIYAAILERLQLELSHFNNYVDTTTARDNLSPIKSTRGRNMWTIYHNFLNDLVADMTELAKSDPTITKAVIIQEIDRVIDSIKDGINEDLSSKETHFKLFTDKVDSLKTEMVGIVEEFYSNTKTITHNTINNNSTTNWLNLDYIKENLNKFKTKEEKLQWLVDNNLIDPFVVNNKSSNYLKTLTSRVVVKVKIGNVTVPFYISTGYGEKNDVSNNKWYVFFGQGKDGWFNKTSGVDINTQYNTPIFQDIANILNEIGSNYESYSGHFDTKGFSDTKFTNAAEDQLQTVLDFIEPLQPHMENDKMVLSKEELQKLKDNIQKVKDRVKEELDKISNASIVETNIETNIETEQETEQSVGSVDIWTVPPMDGFEEADRPISGADKKGFITLRESVAEHWEKLANVQIGDEYTVSYSKEDNMIINPEGKVTNATGYTLGLTVKDKDGKFIGIIPSSFAANLNSGLFVSIIQGFGSDAQSFIDILYNHFYKDKNSFFYSNDVLISDVILKFLETHHPEVNLESNSGKALVGRLSNTLANTINKVFDRDDKETFLNKKGTTDTTYLANIITRLKTEFNNTAKFHNDRAVNLAKLEYELGENFKNKKAGIKTEPVKVTVSKKKGGGYRVVNTPINMRDIIKTLPKDLTDNFSFVLFNPSKNVMVDAITGLTVVASTATMDNIYKRFRDLIYVNIPNPFGNPLPSAIHRASLTNKDLDGVADIIIKLLKLKGENVSYNDPEIVGLLKKLNSFVYIGHKKQEDEKENKAESGKFIASSEPQKVSEFVYNKFKFTYQDKDDNGKLTKIVLTGRSDNTIGITINDKEHIFRDSDDIKGSIVSLLKGVDLKYNFSTGFFLDENNKPEDKIAYLNWLIEQGNFQLDKGIIDINGKKHLIATTGFNGYKNSYQAGIEVTFDIKNSTKKPVETSTNTNQALSPTTGLPNQTTAVIKASENVSRPEDSKYYFDKRFPHIRHIRVSDAIRERTRKEIDNKKESSSNATVYGEAIDTLLRDIINDNIGTWDSYKFGSLNTTIFQSSTVFDSTIEALKSIITIITERGYTIEKGRFSFAYSSPKAKSLSDRISVITDEKEKAKLQEELDKELSVAGEIDLLAKDADGKYHLFDLKTSNKESHIDEDWTKQLSAYAIIMGNNGIQIETAEIIRVHLNYSDVGISNVKADGIIKLDLLNEIKTAYGILKRDNPNDTIPKSRYTKKFWEVPSSSEQAIIIDNTYSSIVRKLEENNEIERNCK